MTELNICTKFQATLLRAHFRNAGERMKDLSVLCMYLQSYSDMSNILDLCKTPQGYLWLFWEFPKLGGTWKFRVPVKSRSGELHIASRSGISTLLDSIRCRKTDWCTSQQWTKPVATRCTLHHMRSELFRENLGSNTQKRGLQPAPRSVTA